MGKQIITISREFGSGGRFLGESIAKKLGYDYYDKEIISKVAEETGLSEKFIEEAGEYAMDSDRSSSAFIGRSSTGASLGDYMYAVQRKLILEAVQKGPCVIIGRCADYILKDRQDCLNVFISGRREQKAARIMGLYNVSEQEAKKQMLDTDKRRSAHYSYYTQQEWGRVENYALCLNSSDIGYDKCIEIICSLTQK